MWIYKHSLGVKFISQGKIFYVGTLDIYTSRKYIYIFFFSPAVLTKFLIILDSMGCFLNSKEKFQIFLPSFCIGRRKVGMLWGFTVASTLLPLFSSGRITLLLCLNLLICLKMLLESWWGIGPAGCPMTLCYVRILSWKCSTQHGVKLCP